MGSEQLGMDSLTIGFSTSGMKNYIDELRLNMLEATKAEIVDFDYVRICIEKAWQGQARDTFLREFEDARQKVKDELDKEFANLETRLNEIQTFYLNADATMMDRS